MWFNQIGEDLGVHVSVAYVAPNDRTIWKSLRSPAGHVRQFMSEYNRTLNNDVLNVYII